MTQETNPQKQAKRPPTPREALLQAKRRLMRCDDAHDPQAKMAMGHIDAALEAPDPVEELVDMLKEVDDWGLADPRNPVEIRCFDDLVEKLDATITKYGGKQ